ncbi:transcriptional regulator, TetR family [Haladaptatus litoreus]|uniref:Transcriptional regulator, TetR family n=1 Tax=Haladaptatus litoreus TaxID=553468 RepID=A0A1N6VED0_9EURY|nr:TetR/AcrR family transcriptional regulator [Haladaptatus litoreus]SIQ76273.1 transcriptional regulator, TetR family [Haladaptatus litoreus]
MRGFDENQRERIRDELIEAGRDLFAQYGLQKTTIADLTDAVGIANGTFYQFFDSKELLYFEAIQREGHEVADEMIANSLGAEDDPERAIRNFLHSLVETTQENRLFKQLLDGEEMEQVMRKVSDIPEEEMEVRRADSFAHVLPYVEQWQAEGKIRDGDPIAIIGTMGAVKYLPLYSEQLGEDNYPIIRDMLIDTIAAGLMPQD